MGRTISILDGIGCEDLWWVVRNDLSVHFLEVVGFGCVVHQISSLGHITQRHWGDFIAMERCLTWFHLIGGFWF